MATTYYSTQVARGDVPRMLHAGVFPVYGNFALTAALDVDDVIQMCKVPLGASVLSIDVYSDDLDTNATPLITLDIGDGNSVARYSDNNTLAQGGGFMRGIQTKAGFGYKYTVQDTIDIKVSAAPGTGATSGDILMIAYMTMDK